VCSCEFSNETLGSIGGGTSRGGCVGLVNMPALDAT
jgi:hypothetical protein